MCLVYVVHFLFLFLCSGILTDELRTVLETNLPKVKEGKKSKFSLGVSDPKIGSQISELTKIPCQSNEFVAELLRGVRLHFDRFVSDLKVSIYSCLVCFCRSRITVLYRNIFRKLFYLNYFFSLIEFCSPGIWKRHNLVWGIVTAEQR